DPISFPIEPPPPRLGNELESPRVSSPLPWPVCTPPAKNTSTRITIVFFIFRVHQIESVRPVRSPSTSSSPHTSPTSAVDCCCSGPPQVFSS
uniref:Uncharacterized protein n=1 Tax=Triticum urartu TaxID=4572 RepID=A0A8R7QDH7_TRIUA